jgi:hypothetical protein
LLPHTARQPTSKNVPIRPASAPVGAGSLVRETNGPAAVAILVYLGLSLQLLQAGIIPPLPQIGKARRLRGSQPEPGDPSEP